jgi:hypothetical protein
MSESNNLIKNIIIDTAIITIIGNSISNDTYKICFYGVVSIYLLKKYI